MTLRRLSGDLDLVFSGLFDALRMTQCVHNFLDLLRRVSGQSGKKRGGVIRHEISRQAFVRTRLPGANVAWRNYSWAVPSAAVIILFGTCQQTSQRRIVYRCAAIVVTTQVRYRLHVVSRIYVGFWPTK